MPTELVLLDFDGTLADTLPDDIILKNFRNKETVQHAIQEYYDLYRQGHSETIDISSIIALLQFLKAWKKIGVITGKSKQAYKISSEALNLTKYFDLVVTGNDVVNPKPQPEGILQALDFFGIKADNTVFLGDSNADIMAGKAAGVRTFAVQWLSTFQSSVFEIDPDRIFKSTFEFIELIETEDINIGD